MMKCHLTCYVCVFHDSSAEQQNQDFITSAAMPELPEVEGLRSALERECLGKKIVEIILKEGGGGKLIQCMMRWHR